MRRALVLGMALPWLVADSQHAGGIDLYLFGDAGTKARLYERVDERRSFLGDGIVEPPGTAFRVVRAATWRCDRRTRRFEADAARADGTRATVTFSVRTPPCHDRLVVRVKRTPPTRLVTVEDRWKLGDVAPRVCVAGWGCRRVAFGARSTARVAVPARGRVTARLGPHRFTPVRLPPLVVTGDSTVQNVDTALAERLAGTARVVRAWRGGTAVSVDSWRWTEVAEQQARRHRPRVTVISIGANEGYGMRTPSTEIVTCCGPAWRAEYARRAQLIMRAYARGGRGSVLWMLLPMPRDERRVEIVRAVNDAIRTAADGEPGVRVLPVDELITPGGTFRRRLAAGGPVVRERDGVHLTPAGGALVADLVIDALPPRLRP